MSYDMCKYEVLVEVGSNLQRYWLYLVSTRFIGDDTSYLCENTRTNEHESIPWTNIHGYALIQRIPVLC